MKKQTKLTDFTILQKLGKGSFGQAYNNIYDINILGKLNNDNQEYAMKKVRICNIKLREREDALNEIRILFSIQDQNIIGYKEAFFDEQSNSLCIIMEYASRADIAKQIQISIRKHTLIEEKEIWKALIYITMAKIETGTPYYASPEVCREQPYSNPSDTWPLGCFIYEMATLKPPFRATDLKDLFRKISAGIYENYPNSLL